MIDQRGKHYSDERLKELIAEAMNESLKKAVEDAIAHQFQIIGVLTQTPKEQQEASKDLSFLRALRNAFEGGAAVIGKTVMTALVAGILSLFWYGFTLKR